jgi:phosphoserine phosphatase
MGTDPISTTNQGRTPFNLVIQGPALESTQVNAVAAMAKASAVEPLASTAFRLRNAQQDRAVAAWCEEQRIDHAWMPEGRRFAELKLLAMDMDSTLITIECIDELGELAGKKAEIAAITQQAMRGELDFAGALRRRVAALAGLPETSLAEVYERRLELTPGAELLLQACKAHGVKVLLVSGGFSFFTERLKARLGLDYTISNRLEIGNGRLTGKVVGDIVGAEAKAAKFRDVLEALGASKSQSVAIGDGANDLKMMAEAGLSVAFHAKPVVRAQAHCAISWSGLDAVVNLFE